jgi:hypothetical protein
MNTNNRNFYDPPDYYNSQDHFTLNDKMMIDRQIKDKILKDLFASRDSLYKVIQILNHIENTSKASFSTHDARDSLDKAIHNINLYFDRHYWWYEQTDKIKKELYDIKIIRTT